jgi:hypothetical protein
MKEDAEQKKKMESETKRIEQKEKENNTFKEAYLKYR